LRSKSTFGWHSRVAGDGRWNKKVDTRIGEASATLREHRRSVVNNNRHKAVSFLIQLMFQSSPVVIILR